MLTQTDKIGYVIEGRMLDWYLAHSMRLKPSTEYPTGICKNLVYLKSKLLKPYIEDNLKEKSKAYKA